MKSKKRNDFLCWIALLVSGILSFYNLVNSFLNFRNNPTGNDNLWWLIIQILAFLIIIFLGVVIYKIEKGEKIK